jgi:hypothetical protein
MIQEALAFLRDRFSKARRRGWSAFPAMAAKPTSIKRGKVTPYDVTPPLRRASVNAVDDLIAAAQKWNTAPVVWISGDAIVLVTDDADRRDSVTLKLSKSAAFAKLICLNQSPVLDQRR